MPKRLKVSAGSKRYENRSYLCEHGDVLSENDVSTHPPVCGKYCADVHPRERYLVECQSSCFAFQHRGSTRADKTR